MFELAKKVVLKAGKILKENIYKEKKISYKGRINLVTQMDTLSENIIVDAILKKYPSSGILAEENHNIEKNSPYLWLIDPLDGTTNYASGIPFFCVSVALEEEGEIKFGIIYNPMLEELFTAKKGEGAYLNNKRIYVSKTKILKDSVLATGFPYDIAESVDNNFDHFCNFSLSSRAIRRLGSAGLDLAYTACGRFDGFWELKLSPWDMAAGYILVKEAGGKITDLKGKKFSIYKKEIVASNGIIHNQMLKILERGKNYLG
jgi:myo-inositol-1(or 4)-monophosphatase